jgi:hypothetical protein
VVKRSKKKLCTWSSIPVKKSTLVAKELLLKRVSPSCNRIEKTSQKSPAELAISRDHKSFTGPQKGKKPSIYAGFRTCLRSSVG